MNLRYQVQTHGYAGYTNGCRCDVCRSAKAARTREYRAERRKALALVRSIGGRNFVAGITHGYSGYQNFFCRCTVCTAAKAAEHQRRRNPVETIYSDFYDDLAYEGGW